MTDRSDEILQLCAQRSSLAIKTDGDSLFISLPESTAGLHLHENGFQFHEMSYGELLASCVGLSRVLLNPKMTVLVDRDHALLWSWFGAVTLNPRSGFFDGEYEVIKNLVDAVVRCSLVHSGPREQATSLDQLRAAWQARVTAEQICRELHPHAAEFLRNSSLALAHLSFPLLDAMLKRACSEWVTIDGLIVKEFVVEKTTYAPRSSPTKGRRKTQISSIKDLLHLLYTKVADDEFRTRLDTIAKHLRQFGTTETERSDAFELIYRWRNSTLHGQLSYEAVGGTILNIAIMVALFPGRDSYDVMRARVVNRLQRVDGSILRDHPAKFYPPD